MSRTPSVEEGRKHTGGFSADACKGEEEKEEKEGELPRWCGVEHRRDSIDNRWEKKREGGRGDRLSIAYVSLCLVGGSKSFLKRRQRRTLSSTAFFPSLLSSPLFFFLLSLDSCKTSSQLSFLFKFLPRFEALLFFLLLKESNGEKEEFQMTWYQKGRTSLLRLCVVITNSQQQKDKKSKIKHDGCRREKREERTTTPSSADDIHNSVERASSLSLFLFLLPLYVCRLLLSSVRV